jgi:hypothetical protein
MIFTRAGRDVGSDNGNTSVELEQLRLCLPLPRIPTQLIAIEERNGQRRGKRTAADGNVIRRNVFRNPENAKTIVVGPSTQVDQPGANVVRK